MRVRQGELLCFAAFIGCVAGCTAVPEQEFELTALNEASATSEDDAGDDGPEIICEPGQTRCMEASTLEVCAATGLEWEVLDCAAHETCEPCDSIDPSEACAAACVGPCDRLTDAPTSAGCSFYATSLYGIFDEGLPSALVVTNPDTERSATVVLSFVALGTNNEQPVGEAVTLVPGGVHVFELPWDDSSDYDHAEYSLFRSGQVYHVTSNLPLHAHLHTP